MLSGTKQDIWKNIIVYYKTSVYTASIIQVVDAVMSWMLDGELHLYHQQLRVFRSNGNIEGKIS
ncbi:hypothetical protein CEE45_04795 [Candidatus Heimdallarchaeota archaeon B3_Heim]|nr:MAG: hypothetical protein CEE45_04795 [Candidatus Heimdallarchaeota archaeon B3_Heim]